jgi:hypothetical protein
MSAGPSEPGFRSARICTSRSRSRSGLAKLQGASTGAKERNVLKQVVDEPVTCLKAEVVIRRRDAVHYIEVGPDGERVDKRAYVTDWHWQYRM